MENFASRHCWWLSCCFILMIECRLCGAQELASMDAADGIPSAGHAALAGSTWAHGQDEVGILAADHGASVIRSVVSGSASRCASRAADWHTCWVVWVVLHRRDNLHATSREWVAVDVGQIVGDLSVGPCELELGDRSRRGLLRRQLDRDTHTWLAVALAVATLELLHARVGAATNRCVVDWEATVVDDGGSPHSHNSGSGGKQHGCARSQEVLELHVD